MRAYRQCAYRHTTASAGYTLVELLTTIVVAAIAAGLIYAVYSSSVRTWAGYRRRLENVRTVYRLYLRIDREITHSVKGGKSPEDSDIRLQGDSLFIGEELVSKDMSVQSFGMRKDDAGSFRPVMSCSLRVWSDEHTTALKWRAVCTRPAEEDGRHIPPPVGREQPEEGLYWEWTTVESK